MQALVTYNGKQCEFNCIGCDVYDGRIDISESIIFENEHWRVMQDTEHPIVGFFTISSKRHFRTLLDMKKEEEIDLFSILLETRRVMKKVLEIEKASLIQEDGPEHMHFHPWFFPWHDWMDEFKGEGKETNIIRGVMKHSRGNKRFRSIEHQQKISESLELCRKHFRI